MIIPLSSIPNKLKTILDRLTSARAGYLDYLTSISTWTSATNAKVPDNAAWTNALATQLGNLTAGALKSTEYTATGAFTFTAPANVSLVWVTLQGAGASGARGYNTSYYGGGGGGGCCLYRVPYKVTGGGTVTGSVGTGGAAITVDNTNGSNGGNTTFGGLTAIGGKGGVSSTQCYGGDGGGPLDLIGQGSEAAGTDGGRGTVHGYVLAGAGAGKGYSNGNNASSGGPAGIYTGGVSASQASGGGGASWFANGANGTTSSNPGISGSLGSGGSGSYVGYNSGAGGNGYVLIEYVT